MLYSTSSAFLAEVRAQRDAAKAQLDQAVDRLDEWGQFEARGRLRDLDDLLARNDALGLLPDQALSA